MKKFIHCPRCGQRQDSDEIRFCTKCGLEIGDVKELLAPESGETKAKRKSEINKAKRQGMLMIFTGFILVIILAILRDFYTLPKSSIVITVLIFIVGGGFIMSMPSLFGGNNLTKKKKDSLEGNLESDKLSGEQIYDKSLPEAEYQPPVNFGKQNFDTNELVSPSSVTEHTTRKLEKEFQTE